MSHYKAKERRHEDVVKLNLTRPQSEALARYMAAHGERFKADVARKALMKYIS